MASSIDWEKLLKGTQEHYTIKLPPTPEEWSLVNPRRKRNGKSVPCEYCHDCGFMSHGRVCNNCKTGRIIFAEEHLNLHQCNYKYHTPGVSCFKPSCVHCKGKHHASSHYKGQVHWLKYDLEENEKRTQDKPIQEDQKSSCVLCGCSGHLNITGQKLLTEADFQ